MLENKELDISVELLCESCGNKLESRLEKWGPNIIEGLKTFKLHVTTCEVCRPAITYTRLNININNEVKSVSLVD